MHKSDKNMLKKIKIGQIIIVLLSLIIFACSKTEAPSGIIEKADELKQDYQFNAALAAIDTALLIYKNDPKLIWEKAAILDECFNDTEGAAAIYSEYLKLAKKPEEINRAQAALMTLEQKEKLLEEMSKEQAQEFDLENLPEHIKTIIAQKDAQHNSEQQFLSSHYKVEIENTKQKLFDLQETIVKLQRENSVFRESGTLGDATQLLGLIESNELEIARLKNVLEESETQKAEYAKGRFALQSQINELKDKLEKTQNVDTNTFAEQLSYLNTSNNSLLEKIIEFSNDFESTKTLINTLSNELISANYISNIFEEISINESNSTKVAFENATNELNSLQNAITELETKNAELETNLTNLVAQNNEQLNKLNLQLEDIKNQKINFENLATNRGEQLQRLYLRFNVTADTVSNIQQVSEVNIYTNVNTNAIVDINTNIIASVPDLEFVNTDSTNEIINTNIKSETQNIATNKSEVAVVSTRTNTQTQVKTVADQTTKISNANSSTVSTETAKNVRRQPQVYYVQQGDSLKKISEKFYKTPDRWQNIIRANNLNPGTPIQIGQKLIIP